MPSEPFALREVTGRAIGVEEQALKIAFGEVRHRDGLPRSTPHEPDTVQQCQAEQLAASFSRNMAESSCSLKPQCRGTAAKRDAESIRKKG